MNSGVIVAVIGGLLGGSAVAAVVNQIGETVRQRRAQQYKASDRETEALASIREALKWVLYYRIRYDGQGMLQAGSVDYDDRRILNEMHRCYHTGLGGNGDLDNLMKQVNKLPLVGTRKEN